jgi:hypothetical protein
MYYNKDTHKLKAQKVTGQEAIQLRGLCKHIIYNRFHLTITDDEYYKYF